MNIILYSCYTLLSEVDRILQLFNLAYNLLAFKLGTLTSGSLTSTVLTESLNDLFRLWIL